MRALVDGDIIVYRCGFAAEHNRYLWDEYRFESHAEWKEFVKEQELDVADMEEVEVIREYEPVSHALANVKSVMADIANEMETDDIVVYLSQGECFRNDIATIMEYKGNRRDAPKPKHYEAIREYLAKHWPTVVVNSIEADDALALNQTDDTVIVSIDKDLLQIPGKHYNWVRRERLEVSPEVGRMKFWVQVLTGDATDNIPGIYGVGPKRAKAMVEAVVVEDHPALAEDDYYHLMALKEWEQYMHSAAKKPFLDLDYDDHYNMWSYEHWSGAAPRQMVGVHDIVEEISTLVRIGGEHAKQALEESGEEISVPSTEEREESAAA
jgi:hypothetical protein